MNPTQKTIKRLFLSIAISVATLIAETSSAAAPRARCDGQLESGTYDTVEVLFGTPCFVDGAVVTVERNVIMRSFSSLTVRGGSQFTVNGNFLGDHGFLTVRESQFTVNGSVRVDEVIIRDSVATIHGDVTSFGGGTRGEILLRDVDIGGLVITDFIGISIRVENSRITGNVLLQHNRTSFGFNLVSNQIVGNLVCNDNNPGSRTPIMLSSNNVSGQANGQCAFP